MARSAGRQGSSRRTYRKPLPLPAQQRPHQQAGGGRNAQTAGHHRLALRALPPARPAQFRRHRGHTRPGIGWQAGRGAGIYPARFLRRLGAHPRKAARTCRTHPPYGMPGGGSADTRPALRPAARRTRLRRPHGIRPAGQRHGTDGCGMLRRHALLRQFTGRIAGVRHTPGARSVAAQVSRRALHDPALHGRARDRRRRLGRDMGLRRPDICRPPRPSSATGSSTAARSTSGWASAPSAA